MDVDGCSLPAPGYFNDDDTVDFMLHMNHGVYPDYDYSMVCHSLCLSRVVFLLLSLFFDINNSGIGCSASDSFIIFGSI